MSAVFGKVLILFRHGKAAPKNVGLSDFERPLTNQGTRDCDKVAREAAAMNLGIDAIYSSPADRALESAHRLAGFLNFPYLKIGIVDSLYSSTSIKTILRFLQSLSDDKNTVVLCGHNPAIDQLANHFVPKYKASIAKGALVGIALNIDSWRKLSSCKGTIRFEIDPSKVGSSNNKPTARAKAKSLAIK